MRFQTDTAIRAYIASKIGWIKKAIEMYKGKKAFVIQIIVIAALYVGLTVVSDMFGMAKGIVQVRIADALTILPYFTPAAIPGLFIGCLIANTVIGTIHADIIFGSLATLAAACISYLIRKNKWIVCVPPVILTSITVPLLFKYAYRYDDSFSKCLLTVGIGEIVACGLLGTALLMALEDSRDKLFPPITKKGIEEANARMLEKQKRLEKRQEENKEPEKSIMELKEEALRKENEEKVLETARLIAEKEINAMKAEEEKNV